MNVGRRICLGAEQEWRGDLFEVTVSACQAISTAKGLAEGAEDGVRDTLCGSVCIGPYGDEYQGLGKPARARRSSRDRSDEGLVFVISRAALLFNRSKRAASEATPDNAAILYTRPDAECIEITDKRLKRVACQGDGGVQFSWQTF